MDYTDFVVDRAQHMRPLEYDLSESYNELVRYLHDMGVLDNVPVATLGPSEILSASDALAAPLRSLVVGGSSMQDGTPTPDAPVPILSVDALTVHVSADGTTDYTNWPVNGLLPNGTSLRSLSDGIRDVINLTYLRPSARNGWSWYLRELITRHLVIVKSSGFSQFAQVGSTAHHRVRFAVANSMVGSSHSVCDRFVYNSATYNYGVPGDYYISGGYAYFVVPDSITSLSDANAWLAEHPITLVYTDSRSATPSALDPIELPDIPSPAVTIWCDGGSATPQLTAEYIRNLSASISDMQETIADIISG